VSRDEVIGQGSEAGGKPFALGGGKSEQRPQGFQPERFGLREFSFPGIENGYPGMGPVEGAFSEKHPGARRMMARGRKVCIEYCGPDAFRFQCIGLTAGAGEALPVSRKEGDVLLEPCLQVLRRGEPALDPLPQDVVIMGAFQPVGFAGGGIQDEVEDKKTSADFGRKLPRQSVCHSLRPGKIAKRGND
jgi:hypothetical protein